MANAQSPQLGYNTNIRHKGKVFHLQTEDSGVLKPHVMTHLFADGGRIVKSQKTSYVHLLETEDLSTQVKKLMQDQHKAMFLALREGKFDEAAGVEAPRAQATDVVEADIAGGEIQAMAAVSPSLSPGAPVMTMPPSPRSRLTPAPSVLPPPLPMTKPVLFVSELSLEEVILAFLTEELEASSTG